VTITAHDLTIRADITYRQLDFWTRGGFITAEQRRPGSGHPREYDEDQVPLARLMGQLTAQGLVVRQAYLAALALLEDGHAELGPFTVTIAPSIDRPTGDTAA
jgi:DNA-binding transcriptional MerR regulator